MFGVRLFLFDLCICSIQGKYLLECTHLKVWVVKLRNCLVGVDGDKSCLRLIVTCPLPGLFIVACFSRMGFVAQNQAIVIV